MDERLKARWARNGWGPEDEAELKRAEAELARLEASRRHPSPLARAKDARVAPPTPPRADARAAVDAARGGAKAANARETARASRRDGRPNPDGPPSDDDDEVRAIEAGCRDAFASAPPPALPPAMLDPSDPVVALKDDANAALRDGDVDLAVATCDEALAALETRAVRGSDRTHPGSKSASASQTDATRLPVRASPGEAPSKQLSPSEQKQKQNHSDVALRAVLLLNRAKAKTLLDPPDLRSAALDARSAADLQPHWPKAFHRLALIESRLKNYAAAIDACRAGSAAAERAKCMTGEFKHLWDDVAIDAAMNGSLVGFDGRVIFVRSAGEEAWLGREAPEHYAFDGAEDADDVYAKRAKRAGLHDAGCFTGAAPIEPLHARSLVDAMELASDGDRILLLRGVHNGMGHVATVDKRILVRGEGALRDATVDCRNNAPTFRVERSCVLQNLDLDHTGFCEAVLIAGDRRVRPLIERCGIKDSGDAAVVCAGSTHATFRDVEASGRKAGFRFQDRAEPALIDCAVKGNGQCGVMAHDESRARLTHCVVEVNAHEGAVSFGDATLDLVDCVVRDNGGPGVDASDGSSVSLVRTRVEDNVGGVWAWDAATLDLDGCDVNGGKSHAVLCDGDQAVVRCANGCVTSGVVFASDEVRALVEPGADGSCAVEHPEHPTDLPPEIGCFKFEYDQFQRKQ